MEECCKDLRCNGITYSSVFSKRNVQSEYYPFGHDYRYTLRTEKGYIN